MKTDKKIIIIGYPRCSKIALSKVENENCQAIFEREVKKLQKLGVFDTKERIELAISHFSNIPNALGDLNIAIKDFSNIIGEMPNILSSLKPIPIENEPSKYFSKPKNNYKK